MKLLKRILLWLFLILISLNLLIIISGKAYLYKAVSNTYLKGRSGPSIDEFRIFPYNEVEAGQHLPWPEAEKQLDLPDSLRDQINVYETIAFLVIKNDSIIYEDYSQGYSKDAVTNSFSMAKTIVSILTGIAIKEGKIKSVNQPVSDFLPDFKEGLNKELTIKHLLTMSSGINFDEDYGNPFAYPAIAYYGTDLKGLTNKYEVVEQPGKSFNYLSGNTQLLGFIIQKATGMSISEYASEKLWKKIGAKNTAYWSLDKMDGVEKAYCCFNSNARDFARIGKLYLDSGTWNNEQIVPVDYVLNSIKPATLNDGDKKNKKYGYKWWLLQIQGKEVFYARGILGQYLFVIPSEELIVVRLGHKRDPLKIEDHPKDVFLYLKAALYLSDKYEKRYPGI